MERNPEDRGRRYRLCMVIAQLNTRDSGRIDASMEQLTGSANNADPAWDFSLHQADAPRRASDQNRRLMTWAKPRS
jgi:hypothetical protein